MFKIWNTFWSNLVKWQTKLLKMKIFEYQVVWYHQDVNFIYIQFLHLRMFKLTIPTKSWISHKLYEIICVNYGFSTTRSQHFVKCKIGLYIKCRFCEWNNIGIHDFSIRDHLGFRTPMHGYEFFQNSKLSGSNFSKWKVDH